MICLINNIVSSPQFYELEYRMSRCRRTRRVKASKVDKKHLEFLEMSLVMNGHAIDDGPKRKNWTKHDIRNIRPLNPAQEDMFHAFFNGYNICAYGSAGSGKSFIALYLALNEIFTYQKYKKIKIVRSAVPTRDLGFMPGDLSEKLSLYESPYRDIVSSLVGKSSTYDDMKQAGIIEFVPTSFLRGLTWDDCIVIIDESQSMSFHEISSTITRIGNNSRLFILGDLAQNDLIYKKNDVSGFDHALKVIEKMSEFSMVRFTHHDIVRSSFVKSWIMASEDV